MTRIRYGQDLDALLVELSDEAVDHAEEAGRFIVHVSKTGNPVLLEILDASDFVLDCLTSVLKGKGVRLG